MNSRQVAGLSHVVERILGKPVDKSMQVSNWELRPLSEAQVKYAAQDAHVLLLLHDRMIDDPSNGEYSQREELPVAYSAFNVVRLDSTLWLPCKKVSRGTQI